MKHMAFNKHTDTMVNLPQPGKEISPDLVFYWIPRIKCLDCPNQRMLYKPGPGMTTSNFQVHLNNRNHQKWVDIKMGRLPPEEAPGFPGASGTPTAPASGPTPSPAPVAATGSTPTTNPP